MANFKNSLDPPTAISFQIQRYCLSFDMFRVAAVAYRVMAPSLFAQISLLFIVESAFYSFFAPAFRAFKVFIHTLILHYISNFSNAANVASVHTAPRQNFADFASNLWDKIVIIIAYNLHRLSVQPKYFPKIICLSSGKISDGHFSNARILSEGLAKVPLCVKSKTLRL